MSKYDAVPPADPTHPVLALGVVDVIAVDDLSAPGTPLHVSARGKWTRDVIIPDGVPDMLRELSERYNIVWASEWGPNAHYAFQAALGLPATPWPYLPVQFNKQQSIERYAGDLPWTWIDSPVVDLIPADPSHGRIIRVDPTRGLQLSDISELLTA